jgi:hypothetical protein
MASKYRKKFSLPEGFYPVLEAYSREVLRDQPIDIIEFSYLYFKALEEVTLIFSIILCCLGNNRAVRLPKEGCEHTTKQAQ